MDVLITGCDTDLGRTIAQNFAQAGHDVILAAARRQELEVLAKELDVSDDRTIAVDNGDPQALAAAQAQFPAHLDTVVNVPAATWQGGDPRAFTLADHAAQWRHMFDSGLVAAMLTVQVLGDQLRSGGSIITVVPEPTTEGSAGAAVKAAISDWTAGQAHHFGIRGITVNAVAAGRGYEPGYDSLGAADSPTVSDEIARLSLFLTTPAARHITGQTLHVSHGALAHFG